MTVEIITVITSCTLAGIGIGMKLRSWISNGKINNQVRLENRLTQIEVVTKRTDSNVDKIFEWLEKLPCNGHEVRIKNLERNGK